MTWKTSFSDEEWAVLRDAPLMVAITVMQAEPVGAMRRAREIGAAYEEIEKVVEHGSEADLIRAVADDLSRDRPSPPPPPPEDQHDITSAGCEQCRRAAAIVDDRCPPQEAAAYKRWLLTVGEGVAASAGEHGSGEPVTDAEASVLSQIAHALGVNGT